VSPRVFDRPTDVLAAVGEQLGPGDWLHLTQQRVDTFADATDDHQWIHVDPQRAAAGPFGTTVAHGYLTLSLLPALSADVVTWAGCSARVNYGSDRVRYPRPLPVGSRIRARAEVLDATETLAGVQVLVRWTVEIEDLSAESGVAARPACVAEVRTLLVPA
jgi:acyl dehydratase